MSTLSLTEQAAKAFKELYSEIPEMKGVILATSDGLPLASDMKSNISADKMAALVATALSIGKRIMPSFGMGEVTEFSITSAEGRLFIYLVGSSGALCFLTPRNVNLGIVFLKANEIAKHLSQVMP